MRTLRSNLLLVLTTGTLLLNQTVIAQKDNGATKSPQGSAVAAADYLFRNGAIYTIDNKRPRAEVVAVTGKKISYVGDERGAAAFIGKKTKVIDLKGRMLMPGFVESHIHPTLAFFTGGADLQFDSVDEIIATLKAWEKANPEAKVISGFGWRYNLFPSTGPTKDVLDKAFPDKPVLLFAIDVHSAWVNTKALALAGIDAKFPDPAPGLSYFQRDPNTHEPTGWVVETIAEQLMLAKLNPPTPEIMLAATEKKLQDFAKAGITSIFDAGIGAFPTETGLAGYQAMERSGKLPVRIAASFYWNNPSTPDPVGKTIDLKKKFHSELLQINTLKIVFDGGDFQHTSVMLKPYFDRPDFHGEFQIDPKLVDAAVLKAQANGINTHLHAVGDSATRAYLYAIEAARKAYPKSISRHAVAHGQYLTDHDISWMARMNVVYQSSVQWNMPDPGVEMSIAIIGKDVMNTEYGRVNSMLKAGGKVAFGTDWPAANYTSTFRPLDAIQVAMTRAILPQYGKKQFTPVLEPVKERIGLDQALKAATLDAAYILDLEDRIGSLTVGKWADIVILEKDLYQLKPEEISTVKVMLTMMNGRITHQVR